MIYTIVYRKEGFYNMAYSEKQAAYKYINQYQKQKYDRITILRKSGEKAQLETIAKNKGMSITQFINACIDEKLKRSGITLNQDTETE